MPYCPKCDMEFIDGITVCSDCGEELVPSKEYADARKRQEREEWEARKQAEWEAAQDADSEADDELYQADSDPLHLGKTQKAPERSRVYVKKSQQYEDLKSSASAFLLVGGGLLIFSILCWTGIVNLPVSGGSRMITQSVMTAMGLAALVVAANSVKSAKAVSNQVEEEENATRQLIEWFLANHTGEQMDQQITSESGELQPEELSLKRFELIQDILITSHDIADQAYVDLLADEIYGNIYAD